MKPLALAAALAAALSTAAAAGQPDPAAEAPPGVDATAAASAGGCFRMSQIRSHTIAADDTIYMRVGSKEIYRVTTNGACGAGAMRDDTLILSTVAGTDLICRPIDLDLKIRTGAGFMTPCIVSSIARLSPEQIEAIPAKLRP